MACFGSLRHYYILEVLLDSDDGFPLSCPDDEKLPAFEDDCRFYPLLFSWLESNHQNWLMQKRNNSQFINNNDTNEFISRGFLCQRDFICLKAVAGNLSTDMFLWFVDYLVRKDFQSRFENNHISCLVEKFPCSRRVNEEHNFFKEKYGNSKEQKFIKKDFTIIVTSKISTLLYNNFCQNNKSQSYFV